MPESDPETKTHTYIVNPKSITMGQLYGETDLVTQEWKDGILSNKFRSASEDQTSVRRCRLNTSG